MAVSSLMRRLLTILAKVNPAYIFDADKIMFCAKSPMMMNNSKLLVVGLNPSCSKNWRKALPLAVSFPSINPNNTGNAVNVRAEIRLATVTEIATKIVRCGYSLKKYFNISMENVWPVLE